MKATTLIIFAVIISSSTARSSPSIQITDLQRNPGLLTLDIGKTFVKIGKHQIYHTIDLKRYEPILAKLEIILQGIKSFENYTDITKMLESKFSNTQTLFHNLMPRHRNRRGLFNFLGSTLKQITGNLDDNDLIKISENIRKLESNNEILINENNEQVQINSQLQDRMNRIIRQLEKDHDQIKRSLIDSRTSSGVAKNLIILQDILKTNILIDNVNDHFRTIFEIVQLAKLRVISKDILTPDELKIIIQQFETQKLNVETVDQMYEFLEISSFHNETKIIFVIEIPSLETLAYKTLLLEPLIIKDRTLKVPATIAIINDFNLYFINKPCQEIGRNHICSLENLQNSTNDGCFSMLLNGKPANCSFKEVSQVSVVKPLTPNHLVVKQIKNQEIITSCGIHNRTLTGTFLIEYHNCTIYIDGLEFTNKEWYKTGQLSIVPLDGLDIQIKDLEPEMSFEKIHINNRHHLDSLRKTMNSVVLTSMSLSGVSLLAIIIAILFYMSRKIFHEKQRAKPTGNEDVSDFKEGPVTDVNATRVKLLERQLLASNSKLATLDRT